MKTLLYHPNRLIEFRTCISLTKFHQAFYMIFHIMYN